MGYFEAHRRWDLLRTRDLGDEDRPIGVVGPLQAEIFAPMDQQVGRGVVGQGGAEPTEVLGVLLIEEDRLQVELVQQRQPPQAVGLLDIDGRAGVAPERAIDEVPVLRGGVLGPQHRHRVGRRSPDDGGGRALLAVRRGLQRELAEDAQGGQQDHGGKGLLHRFPRARHPTIDIVACRSRSVNSPCGIE